MVHCDLRGTWMDDFGALVGDLGNLLVCTQVESAGIWHHVRVGGLNSIDVRVNLDCGGIQGGAKRGRCGVAASTAQSGNAAMLALFRDAGDALESTDNRDLATLNGRKNGVRMD